MTRRDPKVKLRQLLKLIDDMKINHKQPIFLLKVLMLVAEKPGKTITELAHDLGASLMTTSDNVSLLADTPNHRRGPSLGLIAQIEDPTHASKKQNYLSTKGQQFLKAMQDIVE